MRLNLIAHAERQININPEVKEPVNHSLDKTVKSKI